MPERHSLAERMAAISYRVIQRWRYRFLSGSEKRWQRLELRGLCGNNFL
jgi:hypothetical protein